MTKNLSKVYLPIIYTLICFSFFSAQKVNSDQAKGLQGKLIYYFSKFIEWPAETDGSKFIVGIYGDIEIYDEITTSMEGRLMNGKPISVQRYSTVSQITKCDVLFIAPNKSSNFYRVISTLKGTNTLLVTQKNGLGQKGSHINLTVVDNRLRFELNKSALTKAGLKVSSTLVKQAIIL